MIICIFFEKQVGLKKLTEKYLENDFIENGEEKYYFDENSFDGFELGFYNWIIEDSRVIGVNFQFNNIDASILEVLAIRGYHSVTIIEHNVNIFFAEPKGFWIDYEDEFIDLFLLKSKNGNIAITFALPDDSEYNTDLIVDGILC